MEITIEEQSDIRIIRLTGRLDGTTMKQLEEHIVQLVDQGCNKFVFDYRNLEYISSAGLRVMLLSVKITRSSNGKVALFGMQDNVAEVFEMSGFFRIFEVFQTEEEAVAYLVS